MKRFIAAFLFMISCDTESTDNRTNVPPTDDRLKILEDQVLALQGSQAQITALINSDFATCPLSGNTVDPLVNKICQISQAATVEARVELKGELGVVAHTLNDQINALSDGLSAAAAQEATDAAGFTSSIATINSQLTTINSSLTTLNTSMTNAETAITALQTLTASIVGTLNGALTTIDIGTENLSAGPNYESILRMTDKSKVNAYIEAFGPTQNLASNPMQPSSGSPTVTVTLTAHGYLAGDVVFFQLIGSGSGFTAVDFAQEFTVQTATANTFTITMRKNANNNSSFGGTGGIVYKVIGRGLGTVWKTVDGADAAVRTTTVGSHRYNWLVKATGFICYDKVVALQTFALIIANGVNIVCK